MTSKTEDEYTVVLGFVTGENKIRCVEGMFTKREIPAFEGKLHTADLFTCCAKPESLIPKTDKPKENTMEFDKNKVISILSPVQPEDGELGWTSDSLVGLKNAMEREEPYAIELTNYASDNELLYDTFRYFYPAPAYEVRQANWVQKHNIKVGDLVKVTRGFKMGEGGSISWAGTDTNEAKRKLVGTTVKVSDIHRRSIAVACGYFVPYTVLEKVEDKYRPFTNEELNTLVGKTVRHNASGSYAMVTGRGQVMEDWVYVSKYALDANELLKHFTIDGHPCGAKE